MWWHKKVRMGFNHDGSLFVFHLGYSPHFFHERVSLLREYLLYLTNHFNKYLRICTYSNACNIEIQPGTSFQHTGAVPFTCDVWKSRMSMMLGKRLGALSIDEPKLNAFLC